MKIKDGIIIRKVDNEYVLLDSGLVLPKFNGMIKLNESSYNIVTKLSLKDMSYDELILDLKNDYELSESAIKAIDNLILQLKQNKILYE